MADILTSQSYADEIYSPHMSQNNLSYNANSYQHQQSGMFPPMQNNVTQGWFDTDL